MALCKVEEEASVEPSTGPWIMERSADQQTKGSATKQSLGFRVRSNTELKCQTPE